MKRKHKIRALQRGKCPKLLYIVAARNIFDKGKQEVLSQNLNVEQKYEILHAQQLLLKTYEDGVILFEINIEYAFGLYHWCSGFMQNQLIGLPLHVRD